MLIKRIKYIVSFLFCVVVLSACANTKTLTEISVDYTPRFKQEIQQSAIFIQPAQAATSSNQPAPFFYKLTADNLAKLLQEAGYNVVSSADKANHVMTVFLSPTSDKGNDIALHTGVALSSGGSNAYGLGISFGSNTLRPYSYYLRLLISDNSSASSLANATTLYEVTALAKSACDDYSSALTPMLAAIFNDFPGNNGQNIRVKSDSEHQCN